jgi:hypothetical protein
MLEKTKLFLLSKIIPKLKKSERKIMKNKLFLLNIVFLILLTQVYGQHNQSKIGEVAPDFNLEDLHGNMVKLSDLLGSFIVIHFAASW